MSKNKFYTDYPIFELGDIPNEEAPVRQVEILEYDGTKYIKIMVDGVEDEIKRGYVYTKKGRYSDVKCISHKKAMDWNK